MGAASTRRWPPTRFEDEGQEHKKDNEAVIMFLFFSTHFLFVSKQKVQTTTPNITIFGDRFPSNFTSTQPRIHIY